MIFMHTFDSNESYPGVAIPGKMKLLPPSHNSEGETGIPTKALLQMAYCEFATIVSHFRVSKTPNVRLNCTECLPQLHGVCSMYDCSSTSTELEEVGSWDLSSLFKRVDSQYFKIAKTVVKL